MIIEQTKCDQCGKTYNTPNKHFAPKDYGLLTVALPATFCGDSVNYERTPEEVEMVKHRYPKRWDTHRFDFCNEDCLREFLIVRKELREAAPPQPQPQPQQLVPA